MPQVKHYFFPARGGSKDITYEKVKKRNYLIQLYPVPVKFASNLVIYVDEEGVLKGAAGNPDYQDWNLLFIDFFTDFVTELGDEEFESFWLSMMINSPPFGPVEMTVNGKDYIKIFDKLIKDSIQRENSSDSDSDSGSDSKTERETKKIKIEKSSDSDPDSESDSDSKTERETKKIKIEKSSDSDSESEIEKGTKKTKTE